MGELIKELKPIETPYNGYRFRSRLEARWAVFFDTLGIEYEYEPEGFTFQDGTKYLPDFYLPQSKQFFEVKGVLKHKDMHKIEAAVKAGLDVVIGYDDGKFQALSSWPDDECESLSWVFDSPGESYLCKCKTCGNYWFLGIVGSFTCRCCGEYDGDHHMSTVMCGDGYGGEAWDCARQARFEYGETPRVGLA